MSETKDMAAVDDGMTCPCVICHAKVCTDRKSFNNWRCDECGRMYCQMCFHGAVIPRNEFRMYKLCLLCIVPLVDSKTDIGYIDQLIIYITTCMKAQIESK